MDEISELEQKRWREFYDSMEKGTAEIDLEIKHYLQRHFLAPRKRKTKKDNKLNTFVKR